MRRTLLLLAVVVICLAAAVSGPVWTPTPAAPDDDPVLATGRPTVEQFAQLWKTDAVAALEASLARTREECRGFTSTLHKRERIGGTIGPPEVIRVACRQEPFAVRMTWLEGAMKFRSPVDTVYVRGENGGRTRVKLKLGLTVDVDPDDGNSRGTSHYSIVDFGFEPTTLRTLRAWKTAKEQGRLKTEYLGVMPCPEVGGRPCHVVKRTCDPPEVDNYSLADRGVLDPKKHPTQAIKTVRLMFDAETWLQVGSETSLADGGLIGSYFFRDVVVNPTFGAETFKVK